MAPQWVGQHFHSRCKLHYCCTAPWPRSCPAQSSDLLLWLHLLSRRFLPGCPLSPLCPPQAHCCPLLTARFPSLGQKFRRRRWTRVCSPHSERCPYSRKRWRCRKWRVSVRNRWSPGYEWTARLMMCVGVPSMRTSHSWASYLHLQKIHSWHLLECHHCCLAWPGSGSEVPRNLWKRISRREHSWLVYSGWWASLLFQMKIPILARCSNLGSGWELRLHIVWRPKMRRCCAYLGRGWRPGSSGDLPQRSRRPDCDAEADAPGQGALSGVPPAPSLSINECVP